MADTQPINLPLPASADVEMRGGNAIESTPLRIPPGTRIAIELLDPAADVLASAPEPSQLPDAEATGCCGGSAIAVPTQHPPLG